MSRFQYRQPAKIIALMELFMLGIISVGIIAFGVMTLFLTVEVSRRAPEATWEKAEVVNLFRSFIPNQFDVDNDHILALFWIMLLYSATVTGIYASAALKLLNATKVSTNCQTALELAEYWRVIAIFATILQGLYYIATTEVLKLSLTTAFSFSCIYFVWKYIEELKMEVARSFPPIIIFEAFPERCVLQTVIVNSSTSAKK